MEWFLIFNDNFWAFAQDLLVAVIILSFFCYLLNGLFDRFKGGKVK